MINTEKRKNYSEPTIVRIVLDNEISLALASDPDPSRPPIHPGEGGSGYIPNAPTQDPFKTNRV